jgi:hypothetical protein
LVQYLVAVRAACDDSAMRRLVLAACLGTASLAAVGTIGTPAASFAPAGVCAGVNAVDVYFWPRGHQAVPEINFPAYPPPHLELYRAHDVANEAFLAYVESGRASYGSACASTGAPPAWGGGPDARTTEPQRLTCTLPGSADARRGPWSKIVTKVRYVRVKGKRKRRVTRRTVPLGSTFTVSAGAGALVQARIGAANSSLRWDTRYCSAIPLLPP